MTKLQLHRIAKAMNQKEYIYSLYFLVILNTCISASTEFFFFFESMLGSVPILEARVIISFVCISALEYAIYAANKPAFKLIEELYQIDNTDTNNNAAKPFYFAIVITIGQYLAIIIVSAIFSAYGNDSMVLNLTETPQLTSVAEQQAIIKEKDLAISEAQKNLKVGGSSSDNKELLAKKQALIDDTKSYIYVNGVRTMRGSVKDMIKSYDAQIAANNKASSTNEESIKATNASISAQIEALQKEKVALIEAFKKENETKQNEYIEKTEGRSFAGKLAVIFFTILSLSSNTILSFIELNKEEPISKAKQDFFKDKFIEIAEKVKFDNGGKYIQNQVIELMKKEGLTNNTRRLVEQFGAELGYK